MEAGIVTNHNVQLGKDGFIPSSPLKYKLLGKRRPNMKQHYTGHSFVHDLARRNSIFVTRCKNNGAQEAITVYKIIIKKEKHHERQNETIPCY